MAESHEACNRWGRVKGLARQLSGSQEKKGLKFFRVEGAFDPVLEILARDR